MTRVDRVVIGGGFAGLLAALRACDAGQSVVILEAESELGGSIADLHVGGHTLDSGAESFSTTTPEMIDLIDSIGGIQRVRPEARHAHIVNGSSRYPIPDGILGIPRSLDDVTVNRVLADEVVAEAKRKDAAEWTSSGSLGKVVTERLGSEFVDAFVRPVVSGVHAVDPDTVDAESLIGSVLAEARTGGGLIGAVDRVRLHAGIPGTAVGSVVGGMTALINRLAAVLDERGVVARLGHPVRKVTPAGGRWVVSGDDGSYDAEFVSLAAGVGSLALIADHIALVAEFVRGIRVSDSTVLLALVESRELNDFPVGTGALVTGVAGNRVKAVTHVNAKWGWRANSLEPNHHLVRMSLNVPAGGNLDEVHRAAVGDLNAVLGVGDSDIVDMGLRHWKGRLANLATTSSVSRDQARDAGQAAGIELCGATLARNGLLAIAREHYERTQQ